MGLFVSRIQINHNMYIYLWFYFAEKHVTENKKNKKHTKEWKINEKNKSVVCSLNIIVWCQVISYSFSHWYSSIYSRVNNCFRFNKMMPQSLFKDIKGWWLSDEYGRIFPNVSTKYFWSKISEYQALHMGHVDHWLVAYYDHAHHCFFERSHRILLVCCSLSTDTWIYHSCKENEHGKVVAHLPLDSHNLF